MFLVEPADAKPSPIVTPPLDSGEAICTFDENLAANPQCGWDLADDEGNAWTIESGASILRDSNVPPFDHTSLESYGTFYIAIVHSIDGLMEKGKSREKQFCSLFRKISLLQLDACRPTGQSGPRRLRGIYSRERGRPAVSALLVQIRG